MRGEHERGRRVHRRHPGIIPACAGSTLAGLATIVARKGSSPHARGALPLWRNEPQGRGIIPACAGSTKGSTFARRQPWDHCAPGGIIPACAGSTRRPITPPLRRRDHPRMRGEHSGDEGSKVKLTGSSPHARGAQRARCGGGVPRGIIPACAGSTYRLSMTL